ncbi:binding-protein-dependent transport systems inner membrane component [Candidatus Moduliflexus flocculans]|uniref:Binding-protein-dependent transport systems inner membrane component n=1 Tax=Candidatus Moduliflexus flocculans TaxID=1499966 RepID=A0A081BR65_9BACT|nr:binding-protein-dependent transport systems inner membrane component [Candidatus Moduliflexus flocculans]
MKKSFGLWALLFPAGFWLFFFFLVPLGIILVYSFVLRGVYGGVEWTGTLENYTRAIDPLYVKILWRSLGIALFTTIFCLLCGYPLAYFIAFAPRRWKNLLLILLIIPFWTNFLIRTYSWIVILQEEGLINSLLLSLGVIHQPLNLLYTMKSVMIGMVYGYLPFMVLPLYSSLEKLQPSLLEASMDLGANRVKTFLHVTLPLTAPGMVAGIILVFIPTIGEFVIPDLLGGAKTVLVGNVITNQFLTARDWPFGAAITFILVVFVLIGLGLSFKFIGNEELIG